MRNDLRTAINLETCFEHWRDSIRARITTANSSSTRARYTLIFLSLVSAGFIMAVFSYFYSWNKEFAFRYLDQRGSKDYISNIVQEGILREWLSTQTYQLPILGIKIMASDMQIFGPLVLLIVSTWNYFEVRREHYTVGRLLGDVYFTMKESISNNNSRAVILCQEVYHNIIGHTVFNVIPYDRPIGSLGEPVVSGIKIQRKSINLEIRRGVIKFLVLTPLLAIGFIALTRVLSFYIIRSSVTGNIHKIEDVKDLRFFLLILSALSILMSIYICFINMKRVFKLASSTRKLLDEYQQWAFEGVFPQEKEI